MDIAIQLFLGELLGHKKAFLIQNMFPVSDKYIIGEYLDKKGVPVHIPKDFEEKLIRKAKKF